VPQSLSGAKKVLSLARHDPLPLSIVLSVHWALSGILLLKAGVLPAQQVAIRKMLVPQLARLVKWVNSKMVPACLNVLSVHLG